MTELIACYWTLAGRYRFGEDDHSPWDFRLRAEAAGLAGYRGFGFKQADLRRILARYSLKEVAAVLADNGLRQVELEALFDWYDEGAARARSDAERRLLLDAAQTLGAHHIKAAGGFSGARQPLERMHDAFQVLARQAREAGTQFTLEPIAFSIVADIDTALAVLGDSAGHGGALMLDSWHVFRGCMDLNRIAQLPASVIGGVELDDGSLTPTGSELEDTLDRRLLPGEGEFDLAGFIAAIRATGYGGPWGVEIISVAQPRPFVGRRRAAVPRRGGAALRRCHRIVTERCQPRSKPVPMHGRWLWADRSA